MNLNGFVKSQVWVQETRFVDGVCITLNNARLTINMKNLIMFYCTKGHPNLSFVEITWIFKSKH
jgi:hypothetical protein